MCFCIIYHTTADIVVLITLSPNLSCVRKNGCKQSICLLSIKLYFPYPWHIYCYARRESTNGSQTLSEMFPPLNDSGDFLAHEYIASTSTWNVDASILYALLIITPIINLLWPNDAIRGQIFWSNPVFIQKMLWKCILQYGGYLIQAQKCLFAKG